MAESVVQRLKDHAEKCNPEGSFGAEHLNPYSIRMFREFPLQNSKDIYRYLYIIKVVPRFNALYLCKGFFILL